MSAIYVIGDVHGQFEMLADALELIEQDGGPDARVVFLGDLCDRGPDAFGVIEFLRLGVAEGRDWTILRGNHDQMFLNFLESGQIDHDRIKSKKTWLNPALGGLTTLESYGVNTALEGAELLAQARAMVPQFHIDFLNDLPLIYESKPYLFVHAGIVPGLALEAHDADDLMWIREPFLQHEGPFDWFVVHGHTALSSPTLYSNRLNLDGGAGYGRPLGIGVLEGNDKFLLTPMGRATL